MCVARKACVGADPAGGDFECGEQAGGVVASVVMGLLLGNLLVQRQDRLSSVQGLDLGFLIDADHDGAGGRVQVQAPTTSRSLASSCGSVENLKVRPDGAVHPICARSGPLRRTTSLAAPP